jgi:hypothetical protein
MHLDAFSVKLTAQERSHLLLYLQRQREALQRTHEEENRAMAARNETENSAAEKVPYHGS